jgi:hypothetical protein
MPPGRQQCPARGSLIAAGMMAAPPPPLPLCELPPAAGLRAIMLVKRQRHGGGTSRGRQSKQSPCASRCDAATGNAMALFARMNGFIFWKGGDCSNNGGGNVLKLAVVRAGSRWLDKSRRGGRRTRRQGSGIVAAWGMGSGWLHERREGRTYRGKSGWWTTGQVGGEGRREASGQGSDMTQSGVDTRTRVGGGQGNNIGDNNTLFKSAFAATNAHNSFLLHQAVPRNCHIWQMPYTQAQLIANAVHLLLASGMFPKKGFKDWEAVAVKTWPALNTFVHGSYGRCLISVQLRDTSGLRGYVPTQNMYATLANGFEDADNNATTMRVTQTAAAVTTGSKLGGTYDATLVPREVTTTINQLSANQTALLQ